MKQEIHLWVLINSGLLWISSVFWSVLSALNSSQQTVQPLNLRHIATQYCMNVRFISIDMLNDFKQPRWAGFNCAMFSIANLFLLIHTQVRRGQRSTTGSVTGCCWSFRSLLVATPPPAAAPLHILTDIILLWHFRKIFCYEAFWYFPVFALFLRSASSPSTHWSVCDFERFPEGLSCFTPFNSATNTVVLHLGKYAY